MQTTLTVIALIIGSITFAIAKLYQWFHNAEIEQDLEESLNN